MTRASLPDGRHGASADIAAIKTVLSLRSTIEQLAGVQFVGHGAHLKACCPFHQEKTPSFFVDEAAGRYKCFGSGCGKGGDVIQFIADWHSLNFRDALSLAREMSGLPEPNIPHSVTGHGRSTDSLVWSRMVPSMQQPDRPPGSSTQLTPIPPRVDLPAPGQTIVVRDDQRKATYRVCPTHVHVYRTINGDPLLLVLRAAKADGGKFFMQARWDDTCWKLARFDRSLTKPVYGIEDIPAWSRTGRNLLIVEGETTRDAAVQLVPPSSGWLVLTAMGGANTVGRADWSPLMAELARRQRVDTRQYAIVIWPDADGVIQDRHGHRVDPQAAFCQNVRESIRKSARQHANLAKKLTFVRVRPPPSVPRSWDIADAVKDGWNRAQLLSQISNYAVDMSKQSDSPGFEQPTPCP
ncbi:MAG: CHC2 zinc finger domain-containing protein [Rhodobacteraceae bacterium]|nr:CHC2 zinc finger domain-containing protein [Paracoccaceae bacterium]